MITAYRGDNVRLTGTVLNQDGEAVDITGWTIVLSAAPAPGDTPVFTVTAALDTPASGTFYFDLTATHTGVVRQLYYDVQATNLAAKKYTLAMDTIEFLQEVTP